MADSCSKELQVITYEVPEGLSVGVDSLDDAVSAVDGVTLQSLESVSKGYYCVKNESRLVLFGIPRESVSAVRARVEQLIPGLTFQSLENDGDPSSELD